MLDEHTLYSPEKGEEIKEITSDIVSLLDGLDPEVSFISLIAALMIIIKHNPTAFFDETSAVKLIKHLGRKDSKYA